MTRYDRIITPADMAFALIESEYCESCEHNKEGLCLFDADKETTNMYTACYNAAITWLTEELKNETTNE